MPSPGPAPSASPAEPSPAEPSLPGRQREARANDSAVLIAAREIFEAQGHGASMADVARHAGVGVGSIYRRYPTKEALVEALRVDGVREAARLAHEVADEGDTAPESARGAVVRFLARQITTATGPILRPTGASGPIPDGLARVTDELRDGLERLVAQDRAAARVPAGFAAADVMQLLLHLRPSLPLSREQADALHLRYLAVVEQGLLAQAGEGVDVSGGPAWDDWVGVWHE